MVESRLRLLPFQISYSIAAYKIMWVIIKTMDLKIFPNKGIWQHYFLEWALSNLFFSMEGDKPARNLMG